MLGPILSAVVLAQVKNRAERAVRSVVLALAAGAMAAVAIGFLVAAGFAALLPVTGPIWTSVIAAAPFAVIALVLFGMKRANRPPDRTPLAGAAMLGAVGGGTATAAAGGDRPRHGRPSPLPRLSSNRLMVILPAAAFAVALIAGRRSRARRWDDDRWD